ncbi:hypothetical protein KA005_74530, partial [bacterium]|nr:hypothetical protein [bacterium]
ITGDTGMSKIKEFIRASWMVYAICWMIIESLTFFVYGDKVKELGITGYLLLVLIPAILLGVVFFGVSLLRKSQIQSTKLTEKKPKDTLHNRWKWRKERLKCSCTYPRLLHEKEATMLIELPGDGLDKFILSYDEKNTKFMRYDKVMTSEIQSALEIWKKDNPDRFKDLRNEPWGLQVRLEKFIYDHDKYQHRIMLSPIKFLYYQAIQSRLWEHSYASLRKAVYENALKSLKEKRQPLLPNHFALHMAIVSSDEKLLIRKRSGTTPLFPNIWEASIGEFMHGPDKRDFPHFNGERQPDLGMFCVNAVYEEINYKHASPSQFKIYGFGIEYRTLAPKLFVIFRSKEPMVTLLSQGEPKDKGQELSSIDLTPESLAKEFMKGSKYLWSPSSRIISLFALTSSATNDQDSELRLKEFRKHYRA